MTDAKPKHQKDSSGGWNARQIREIPSVVDQVVSPRRIGPFILVADLVAGLLSFQVAARLRVGHFLSARTWGLYVIVGVILLGFYLADTYEPEEPTVWLRTAARVLVASLLTGVVSSTGVYILGLWGEGPLYGRSILLSGFIATTAVAVATRGVAVRWARRRASETRWLVIADPEARHDYRQTLAALFPDADVVAAAPEELVADVSESTHSIEQLRREPWSGILLAESVDFPDDVVRKFMDMRLDGTPIYSLARFHEQFLYKVPPSKLEDDWFVFSPGFSLIHRRINLRIKRVIDIVASVLLLLFAAPLMLLVALAIKLESRGPVIYSQTRSGLNGEAFDVHKFRSMVENAEEDEPQWAEDEDPRVTGVGKILRKTRIDELPQLWNVLKGEMSLIGPRPERPHFDEQLEEEIPYYELRYLVKPGITGWAQVMESYGASEEDAYRKLEYDMYYIKNYSLILDLVIMMKTLRVVLFGRGR